MKVFFLSLIFSLSTFALSGKELAQKVYDRADGDHSYSKVTMILDGKGRSVKTRKLEIYRSDDQKGLVKSLVRFSSPKKIQGVSLLTIDLKGENESQLIYLPALKNSKRISSSKKGGRFVQSEIFYEDLRDRHPEQDQHKLLEDGKFMGARDCYRLESVPISKGNSTYAKRVSCIDKKTFIPLEVLFSNSKGLEFKRFRVQAMKEIDSIWTVTRSEMTLLEEEKMTVLNVDKIEYNSKKAKELRYNKNDFN
ncbi:outer membrane lipoprotein-sorting protein [Halobacteriovorax sp. GB3]|uniref:outer membrane lipoprotein-sorting protein n=1 Tax=Halobacteriovorax sp. GB3 TaxID=2719615 RepID=UPI0023621369|nr:outer membrane lipoprotein-sorting protein [Halobacteriovorax sp. GB3]MDD0853853.1 outer membrane lipoprotein-sorting protein [Halobacteriovorax sp. GB3]